MNLISGENKGKKPKEVKQGMIKEDEKKESETPAAIFYPLLFLRNAESSRGLGGAILVTTVGSTCNHWPFCSKWAGPRMAIGCSPVEGGFLLHATIYGSRFTVGAAINISSIRIISGRFQKLTLTRFSEILQLSLRSCKFRRWNGIQTSRMNRRESETIPAVNEVSNSEESSKKRNE